MRINLATLGVLSIIAWAVIGPTDRASADPGWNNGVPGGVADLVVNGDLLSHQWVVRDEKLSGLLCSVQEGGVTPGTHRVIRPLHRQIARRKFEVRKTYSPPRRPSTMAPQVMV